MFNPGDKVVSTDPRDANAGTLTVLRQLSALKGGDNAYELLDRSGYRQPRLEKYLKAEAALLLDKAEIRVSGETSEGDDDWLDQLSEELRLGLEAIATNLREKFGVAVEISD